MYLYILIISLCSITALATIGDRCDFDKYPSSGCYSRANFYCDLSINECVCLPETPVLIDKKLCFKRAKENETCQYNEQCDNDNGLYCSYSDHKLLNNCLPVGKEYHKGTLGPQKCTCIRVNQKQQQHQHQQQNNSHKTSIESKQSNKSRSPQQQSNQNSLPHGSNLPRLVWISLLVCLVGLILLLLMIKSEFYRLRATPRQEDRISINSEADVPPPYEVAIRMKL